MSHGIAPTYVSKGGFFIFFIASLLLFPPAPFVKEDEIDFSYLF